MSNVSIWQITIKETIGKFQVYHNSLVRGTYEQAEAHANDIWRVYYGEDETEIYENEAWDDEMGRCAVIDGIRPFRSVSVHDVESNEEVRYPITDNPYIAFGEDLLLESNKADFRIVNEPEAKECWWVFQGARLILTMGYCPYNSPQGFIHAMPYEKAVEEWGKLKNEGWEVSYCSEEAAAILNTAVVDEED